MQLILFDDRIARDWQPFALTRPAGELLFGVFTQRARAERAFGLACAGYLGCDELAGFDEPGAPPVLAAPPDTEQPRIFLCSRAVPAWAPLPALPAEPAVLTVGDAIAGWFAPAGAPNPSPEFLRELAADAAPRAQLALGGRMLRHVWELVTANSAQIRHDFDALYTAESVSAGERGGQYQAIDYRSGMLRIGAGVTIEPNVVLDFSAGPIWLDDGVTVRAFTRLAGPAYVGHGSSLLGGTFCSISIGPVCKVHGELEESVVLGYSNKAHDGFLGHAYVGRWVNLGAMTTNSDLKNNYGPIRLWTPEGTVDTGEIKLGCLLGDHVKTAIGSLLSTGTVVGAGSSLHGTEFPPTYVPPFSWGSGSVLKAYSGEKFLEVTERMMARRDVTLSASMREMLLHAWQRGRTMAENEARESGILPDRRATHR